MTIKKDEQTKSIDLAPMGVKSTAWHFTEALKKIKDYTKNDEVVLGGDLLKKTDNKIEYLYTSWSYDYNFKLTKKQNATNALKKFYDFITLCEKNKFGGVDVNNIFVDFVIMNDK